MNLIWTIWIQRYMLAFIFAKAFPFAKFTKFKRFVINSHYTVDEEGRNLEVATRLPAKHK